MAKRYVIVLEKIDGEAVILNAATMQQLGLKDQDQVTITSPTAFQILPVKAGGAEPDQIKLPRKVTSVKEGERVTVEPATAAPAAPAPAASGRTQSQTHGTVSDVRWDLVSDTAFDDVVGMEGL